MSVTYKDITFVSVRDAAIFFSEPVWQVEDALNATEEKRDRSFPFGWLMVLSLAISVAPAFCIAFAHQSFLT